MVHFLVSLYKAFALVCFKMQKEPVVFFPRINALRFLAAFAVIITHIELIKGAFGHKDIWKHPIIFNLGGLGVYFFFVLSGFLITYLLLVEKHTYQKIKIKDFYIRRLLRIWPLYYLVIIIGFFVLPHFTSIQIPYLKNVVENSFCQNLILYLIMLPNVAYSMYSAFPHIGQAWSIGVEEQFYIIWPWIIAKSRSVLKTLIFIIGLLISIKVVVLLLGSFYRAEDWYTHLKSFVAMTKFESMAIGGIGAYLLQQKKEAIPGLVYNSFTLNVCILLIPVLIYITPSFLQDGIHIAYSLIFLVIILNVVSDKKLWLNLENRTADFLGRISYGLYMYHLMIIPIVVFILGKFKNELGDLWFNVLLYSITLSVTILIASLSYLYFESFFIKLKSKFSPVHSKVSKD